MKDNIIGTDRDNDVLVIGATLSNCKCVCPMLAKTVASTAEAIRHFKGDSTIHRLYSDGSGEIDSALRELHITLDKSQPGVPQNNAVVERSVQDVQQGARTSMVCVALPPRFVWEFCHQAL